MCGGVCFSEWCVCGGYSGMCVGVCVSVNGVCVWRLVWHVCEDVSAVNPQFEGVLCVFDYCWWRYGRISVVC